MRWTRLVVGWSLALTMACGATERPAAEPTQGAGGRVFEPNAEPTMTIAPTARSMRFVGRVHRIGASLRRELIGRNWHPGCPVGIEDLRHVHVSYWDYDGSVRQGPLIVHEDVAAEVLWVFRRLFRTGFPIHRIDLPPRYRPPRPEDRLSTRNLTSAFNCRPATGSPGSLSHHSYGWAVDINPLQNPYVRSDGSVLRRAVRPYLDRALRRRGMIHTGDVVVRSFARIGWTWGGNWRTLKDYMHFSLTGR